jgi:PDZ domain-containing protein
MNTLCLALAALAAAAVPAAPTPAASASIRFAAGRSARIPIEIAGSGLVFVRARVREIDTWLLVSSGSPSLLSTRVATQASLSGEPGTFSSLPVELLHDVTVDLPGVTLTQATVSSLNLDPMQTSLGHPIGGILGIPFFESFVIILDYAHGQLELHDPKTFAPSGTGTAVPITREAGLPYARARLKLPGRERFDASFLIDSGADNAVILFSPFVSSNRLLDPGAKTDAGEAGTLGAAQRAETVELERFTLRGPVVNLSRSTNGLTADPEHAGLIGGEVLSRFRVTWDYTRARLLLEPNRRYHDPFPYDASGLSLSAQGPDLSTFEVRRVAPGSPGAEAGFAQRDVLLAVDGTPVKQITLHGIRRLFQREGGEYAISVLRDGQIRKLSLKCRRLL